MPLRRNKSLLNQLSQLRPKKIATRKRKPLLNLKYKRQRKKLTRKRRRRMKRKMRTMVSAPYPRPVKTITCTISEDKIPQPLLQVRLLKTPQILQKRSQVPSIKLKKMQTLKRRVLKNKKKKLKSPKKKLQ